MLPEDKRGLARTGLRRAAPRRAAAARQAARAGLCSRVDSVAWALWVQADGIEPGELYAEAAVEYGVAAVCEHLQAGDAVRREAAQEDHGDAERSGDTDQAGEPPAAVRRGRVADL